MRIAHKAGMPPEKCQINPENGRSIRSAKAKAHWCRGCIRSRWKCSMNLSSESTVFLHPRRMRPGAIAP